MKPLFFGKTLVYFYSFAFTPGPAHTVFGIHDKALRWIKSYLTNRSQAVRLKAPGTEQHQTLFNFVLAFHRAPSLDLCCLPYTQPLWVNWSPDMVCSIICSLTTPRFIWPSKMWLMQSCPFRAAQHKSKIGWLWTNWDWMIQRLKCCLGLKFKGSDYIWIHWWLATLRYVSLHWFGQEFRSILWFWL